MGERVLGVIFLIFFLFGFPLEAKTLSSKAAQKSNCAFDLGLIASLQQLQDNLQEELTKMSGYFFRRADFVARSPEERQRVERELWEMVEVQIQNYFKDGISPEKWVELQRLWKGTRKPRGSEKLVIQILKTKGELHPVELERLNEQYEILVQWLANRHKDKLLNINFGQFVIGRSREHRVDFVRETVDSHIQAAFISGSYDRSYDRDFGDSRFHYLRLILERRLFDEIDRHILRTRQLGVRASRKFPEEAPTQTVGLSEEQRKILADSWKQLNDRERTYIRLMYVENLSQRQVAETLGIPHGTVKSGSVASLRRLKRLILSKRTAEDDHHQDE